MSKKGGYKIVSLGGIDLLGESLALVGLYDALKTSYDKPIMLCDINIDGEIKKNALVQANEGANKIIIKNLYGYDLEVSNDDAIIVTESGGGSVDPVLEVEDVKALTTAQCDALKCGDIVLKVDSTGKHAYKVTFKKDNVGLCLTYYDASVIETQSYDYSDNAWVYNSEDKMPLVDVEGAQSGTINEVLGLNSSGKLVKGAVSGGTQLYKHEFDLAGDNLPPNAKLTLISEKSTAIGTDIDKCIHGYANMAGTIICLSAWLTASEVNSIAFLVPKASTPFNEAYTGTLSNEVITEL